MSIPFNDTVTLKGLVQFYEDEIGAENGDVSGSTLRLKKFAADSNLSFDDYLRVAFPSAGTWKLDDSNHSDNFPEIKTNLVSGQREYVFTNDEDGNFILDIFRVYVVDRSGIFHLITPVDPDSEDDMESFYDGRNQTGIPTRYDKTANAILLDRMPDYNATLGLKVSINREASYFTYTDTTKYAGVCGLHHSYFFLKPALKTARIKGLKSHDRLEREVLRLEQQIGEYYSLRTRDQKPRLVARRENNK